MKLIEFVCTANYGRSRVAQLIAKNHLKKIDADTIYGSISSGTSVNDILAGNEPLDMKLGIIANGIERSVYKKNQLAAVKYALEHAKAGSTDETNNAAINYFYNIAKNLFYQEEHEHRKEALICFGIEGVIEETQNQTIARPDTISVLSMAPSNNQKVMEIYKGSGYTPIIDVLSVFATGDPNAQLPNAFGKGKKIYFQVIEALKEQVPKAIDKLIK